MRRLFTSIFLLSAALVQAQVIYVNGSTGDDSYDGLSATVSGTTGPKKTLAAGISAVAADEILSVESGSYAEYVTLNKNIQLVKTGTGPVTGSGFTFVNGAMLTGNDPANDAFAFDQVTVNAGSLVQEGLLLTATGATLYINEGTYPENLVVNKSAILYPTASVAVNGLRMSASGATCTLAGNLTVAQLLEVNQFNGGFLELSAFDLILSSGAMMTMGSGGSYVRTSGTGRLSLAQLSDAATVFPVGTASYYTPVTIDDANNTGEAVRVRVREALNTNSFNPDLPSTVNTFVGLEWVIEESNAGGNDALVRFDYTGASELGAWTEGQNRIVALNDGSNWITGGNSTIGEGFSTASFNRLGGTFAIYSDFPNALPTLASEQIQLFPVPMNEMLQVKLQTSDWANVSLMDMAGRVVYQTQGSDVLQIPTSNLESGAYVVRIQTEKGIVSRPVVK